MLVFDVSINRVKHIDEIYIQRIEGYPGEMCKYKIRKPKGFDDTVIEHHYDDGYFQLMVKAVNILNEKGYEKKT